MPILSPMMWTPAEKWCEYQISLELPKLIRDLGHPYYRTGTRNVPTLGPMKWTPANAWCGDEVPSC